MKDAVYQFLQQIGYTHPIHPAITHLPVGLILGGFIFVLVGKVLRNRSIYSSARHCAVLALIMLPLTALAGYMDWRHYYAGAWLFPIKAKMLLAGLLLVGLVMVASGKRSAEGPLKGGKSLLYLLCACLCIAIGYFGGELVYGRKSAPSSLTISEGQSDSQIDQGRVLFEAKCSFCHYADSTETKVGPGLKGLTMLDKLPRSGWPMSEANIRRQLETPFQQMPPFTNLTPAEEEALVAFLKTL